jgi:diguanylate cyclase (GGDEF)-like protein/PAS domain S-box-containing protein
VVTGSEGFILLVDDEELNRDMLSRRLLRSGFAVTLAASGREALDLVKEQSFDLVLLDQMMPEISGAEVLRTLRATYSPEALPIVMVTAIAESGKVAEALESGANDYITKPIDFKIALARIRSQLARKHAEDALRQSEERYALAAKASRDGLWDWNLLNEEIYFSPRWKQMLGLEDQEVGGSAETWFSRILLADREVLLAAIKAYLDGSGEVMQCAYRMLNARGAVRWMSCRGIVTRDERGRPVRLAGSQSDVTEERTQDALTGIANRLRLLGDLESILDRIGRNANAVPSHAVLFLDVDAFKDVNDRLGHLAGDQLLRSVAGRLERIVAAHEKERAAQLIAVRMGGDEFAILLKAGATPATVEVLALHIQRIMKPAFELGNHVVHCTFSIGIAIASCLHKVPEDLLHDADVAMYTAKRKGNGGIVVFAAAMHDAAVERLELANDLRVAVERDELEVAYQPKVDLSSGLTYGVEALVRWNHPTRGLLQPASFIAIAESTGLIFEIGRWVRLEACTQVRAWQEQFPMYSPLELSVNLSPREFKQPNLIDQISGVLRESGFPAACLHLEITEDVLLEDMPAARFTLHELKKLGISLDIDDFGSGYSSLRYLQELPFDLIKVDRYFIQTLDPASSSSGRLIQSIVSMARDLGMKVVAEGVETREHSLKLQELGCGLGQGYFFSKPLNVAAMHSFLTGERPPARPSAHPILVAGAAPAPSSPC